MKVYAVFITLLIFSFAAFSNGEIEVEEDGSTRDPSSVDEVERLNQDTIDDVDRRDPAAQRDIEEEMEMEMREEEERMREREGLTEEERERLEEQERERLESERLEEDREILEEDDETISPAEERTEEETEEKKWWQFWK